MRQVVVNLLVNAIKYSPERANVTVGARLDEDFIVVEVSDHGPGIRTEDLGHIFELFGQGMRQANQRVHGLGIGLHLVKRITELHGGHVGVTSAPGAGSTFWIRLPVSPAGTLARAA
jgi:signal transduction histidine kinase